METERRESFWTVSVDGEPSYPLGVTTQDDAVERAWHIREREQRPVSLCTGGEGGLRLIPDPVLARIHEEHELQCALAEAWAALLPRLRALAEAEA